MYNIALVAGHYLRTPGKRIPKELDPNETPEWVLNDRVCDKIEQKLKGYTGYKLLRLDDTTGEQSISLKDRTDAANAWGATEYYSVHHNANQGKPWNGGGIVVYVHPDASAASREMQTQLYNALIAKTGLKGDRSNPLAEANLHELRETKMPAILGELGFMDSRVDAPIILTEEFADACAEAYVEVMVKRGNLKKKPLASTAPVTKKENTTMIEMKWLRKGDEGAQVRALQALLIGYGYKDKKGKPLSKDGIFGENTDFAVRNFQTANNLNPDGIVGDNTWGKLLGQ